MYRFLLISSILFIFISDLKGQWDILNEGLKGNLTSIDFINENVGWISGGQGILLKTEDAGKSWHPLPADDIWNIRYIDFLNDSLGWAIEVKWDHEVILKTNDGGWTWKTTKFIYNSGNNWLGDLCAVDHEVVYALVTTHVDEANILKTSDGGETWEDISPFNIDRNFRTAWFFNRDKGIVAGNSYETIGEYSHEIALILTTEDGGITWEEKINPEFRTISDMSFVDDTTGFFTTDYNLLFRTNNAFSTWPTTALFDSTRIFDYHVIDESTIYAIAQNLAEGGWTDWPIFHILVKSTDSGLTWENKMPINWNIDRIYFSNPEVGYMIGAIPFGWNILRTPDGGDSWEFQLLSYPFYDVHFIDKDNGIACGGQDEVHFNAGNVFVTHDGGRTWNAIQNTPYAVNSCQFINDSVGFALAKGYRGRSFWGFDLPGRGFLSKTSTRGNSWITEPFAINLPDSSIKRFSGSDLYFIDEITGWAIGRADDIGAVIIVTKDACESWELVWKSPNQDNSDILNSIFFLNTDTGWTVGDNGLIVKYSDDHQWEKRSNITDLPLNKVYFSDHHNGWIAGGYLNWEGFQSILFKTTTGGETWEVVPDFSYLIHDIYFIDALRGWAVGANSNGQGIILVTTDGGENWFVQVDGLVAPLHAIHFKDGYGWAVGELGLVLRTEDGGASWIDDWNHTVYPARYQLFQNYPNPFNPSTTIQYTIAKQTHVTLKVYDVLGREVHTLVNRKQPAGSHTVEFDASALASGIYYTELKAGHFSKIIKIILLK